MATDPYASTSTVKNILQHVISPKIVSDGGQGYVVKTDLVNINNAVLSGTISSSDLTTGSIAINAMAAADSMHVQDITINVNSGSTYVPRWAISHKDAEMGGSSGSDFCIHRFDDSGNLREALNIQRSDFSTVVQGALTVRGNAISAPTAAITSQSLTTGVVSATTSLTTPTATVSNTLNVGNNLVFASPTAVSGQLNGSLAYTGGTLTFGTNSSSLTGNAVFNNLQAGVISVGSGVKTASLTIPGLNSSSIVMLTNRNSGSDATIGNYSVDTNTPNTLRLWTQNNGPLSFNYFVARF